MFQLLDNSVDNLDTAKEIFIIILFYLSIVLESRILVAYQIYFNNYSYRNCSIENFNKGILILP